VSRRRSRRRQTKRRRRGGLWNDHCLLRRRRRPRLRKEDFGKTGDEWKQEKKKTKTHSLDANGRLVKTMAQIMVW